eukprot:7514098-Alexandrium_andersonii.AAC.1
MHAQLGRLHIQIWPRGTCANRPLHMQSPVVPTTASGTIAIAPAAVMAKPSLLEALVRGPPWPSSRLGHCVCSERLGACAVVPN